MISSVLFPLFSSTLPAVKPKTDSSNEEKVSTYPSLHDAVAEILKQNPQVIAFGEIHPDFKSANASDKTTMAYFTAEVVPSLSENGIKDLILEHILDDRQIETELNNFYSYNYELDEKSTPVLFATIRYQDMQNIINLLYLCRSKHIRVHPGGMTIAQANETIRHPNYDKDLALQNKADGYNGNAGKRAADRLLRQNKIRFAMYGGIVHNNVSDVTKRLIDGSNFGYTLSQRLGKRYVEVDLLDSKEAETINATLETNKWVKLIPKSGVTVDNTLNSYRIFLPR